jgi:Ca2+-binding RTX toxin-like protein
MFGDTRGGNDVLSATGNDNRLYGDTLELFGLSGNNAICGNDVLTVVSAAGQSNELYGDAFKMFSTPTSSPIRGGNDRLIGGAGDDLLVGDALVMTPIERGGSDQLWGDPTGAGAGGADTFGFAGFIGKDLVHDFRPGEGDTLQLNGYTTANGYALTLNEVLDLSIAVLGGNTVIDIGASLGGAAGQHTITLRSFTGTLDDTNVVFTDVA